MGNDLLNLEGLHKRFGTVQALDGAHFSARAGEVHALLGENGAGKTTIMNVVCGLYQPDAGTIKVRGEVVDMLTPKHATDRRIGMVHQHSELVDVFTAFENIVLGAGQRWYDRNDAEHRTEIENLGRRYGLELPLHVPVKALSAGEQQKVDILRALYRGLDILILDEPTTHLAPGEVETLFAAIQELVASGLAVIFISHKLREVLAVSDRVTVMRRGRTVGTVAARGTDETTIVSMLMGEGTSFPAVVRDGDRSLGEVLLALHDVRAADDAKGSDLQVRRGEMVGIAGVAGNGQQRLVELISGMARCIGGSIHLAGCDITSAGVAERIRLGMAVLPEDRLRDGILPSAPLFESYYLGLHNCDGNRQWDRSKLRRRAREAITQYDVRAPSEDAPTAVLSGGNIQKVLVARAMAIADRAASGIVVAMNPTHGLDIASTSFVHEKLVQFCRDGGGVLFISEDLDELLSLCDRIVVLHAGSLVSGYDRSEFDRYSIGADMVGAG